MDCRHKRTLNDLINHNSTERKHGACVSARAPAGDNFPQLIVVASDLVLPWDAKAESRARTTAGPYNNPKPSPEPNTLPEALIKARVGNLCDRYQ